MALPREGKRKSNRDRKNPRNADKFAEERHIINGNRGRQVYVLETKKYVRVK